MAEFEAEVATLAEGLTADTHARAVELAELPQMVRGFGPVKEANVAAYRAKRAELG